VKAFIKDLLEYSHHYNQELAKAIIANPGSVSEKAIKLFNHILNAHQVWNSRIEPNQAPFGVWEIHQTQSLEEIDRSNFENSLLILEKFNLDASIHYTNTQGQAFSNSIRDILFHVINHSTYHRGQIASEFRQHGPGPLVTDYIVYKR